ncbi:MAG: ECF transporter S component [Clostridiales bacterium]|nr:ECF transporter S component [Clostridiales bacterium]
MKSKKLVRSTAFAAMCLALALVLPFLTMQIPSIGQALSPMHIPALLCGFICGPFWGLAVGFVAPLLRHLLFHMPPLVSAIPMAFELAMYGFAAGVLYKLLPKKIPYIYVSLIGAMVAGRIVWGIVSLFSAMARATEFGFAAFIAGSVTGSIPGIICHIILVPLIVIALKKAKLMPEDN